MDQAELKATVRSCITQLLQEQEHRFKTLRAIGDCSAPGTVAAAVYDGHAAARYLQSEQDIYAPLFVREIPGLD